MRGKILAVPGVDIPGVISGEDGRRYRFAGPDMRAAAVRPGQEVDFEASADDAREVYPVPGAAPFFTPTVTDALRQRDWAGFYLNPQGRVGRRDYWLYGVLALLVVNLVLGLLPFIGQIVTLVTAWCGIALAIKRCHDVGRSGWWNLVPAAPLPLLVVGIVIAATNHEAMGATVMALSCLAIVGVYLWFIVAVLARAGDAGYNRFGPPPPAFMP